MSARFEDVQIAVLTRFYLVARYGLFNDGRIPKSLVESAPDLFNASKLLSEKAVERLRSRLLIEGPLGPEYDSKKQYYQITAAGLDRIETELFDDNRLPLEAYRNEAIWAVSMLRSSGMQVPEDLLEAAVTAKHWFDNPNPIASGPKNSESNIPASDRVVSLDHNSDPYKEAVEALDLAVAEFRTSNLGEHITGAERTQVLRELEAGQRLLQSDQVSSWSLDATALKALRWITIKFVEGAIAAVARLAIEAITKLLGP